ncbi:MAG: BspA family leucine-rich repeat surface protein [Lachnospiraceae bacterium]|nr:BspA family leucine-rich repeat surface protein [Lachnospiraceae bacterium]
MNKSDVFISYSSKNKNVADAIVNEFEQNGIKCWYAPRDILPGQAWVSAIREGLESSAVLVLVYTPESNDSRQVMNEVALAFNAGKTIVPFRLSEDQMNDELEYYLTRVHWLDAISEPLSKYITELREYIEVILQKVPEKTEAGKTEAAGEGSKPAKLLPVFAAILVLAAVIVLVLVYRKPEDAAEARTEAEQITEAPAGSAAEPDPVREGKGGTLHNELAGTEFSVEDIMSTASFGSVHGRDEVSTITFLSVLPEREDKGLDISEEADGSVLAWFDENSGGLYDLTVAADGIIRLPEDCSGLFAGYSKAGSIDLGGAVDMSDAADLRAMFSGCKSLRHLDLSGLEGTVPTDLSEMFCDDNALEQLVLGKMDTSKVTSMRCMFWNCGAMRSIDTGSFDTSSCTDMNSMFCGCSSLTELDVSSFDTSEVTDMFSMFYGLASLEKPLELSGFDTSKVTDMYWMFTGYPLAELDVSSFDTSKVENMKNMFGNCVKLRTLDLSGWDFSKVENAEYMFANDTELKVTVDMEQPGWESFSTLERLTEDAESVEFVGR